MSSRCWAQLATTNFVRKQQNVYNKSTLPTAAVSGAWIVLCLSFTRVLHDALSCMAIDLIKNAHRFSFSTFVHCIDSLFCVALWKGLVLHGLLKEHRRNTMQSLTTRVHIFLLLHSGSLYANLRYNKDYHTSAQQP